MEYCPAQVAAALWVDFWKRYRRRRRNWKPDKMFLFAPWFPPMDRFTGSVLWQK